MTSSDEEEDESEFLALSSRYLSKDKGIRDNITDDHQVDEQEEDGQQDGLEEEEDEQRDAWGKDAKAFYDGDSESDESDEEGVSLQLQEARQLRQEHLAFLAAEASEAANDFLLETQEDDDQSKGMRDDGATLDILLTNLASGLARKEAFIEDNDKDDDSAVREAVARFAEGFEEVKRHAEEESMVYLTCVAEGRMPEGLTVSPRAVAYLDVQIQIALWYGLVLKGLSLSSRISPSILAEAERVSKAVKKLEKLRQSIGADHFELLASTLSKSSPAPHFGENGSDESGSDYDEVDEELLSKIRLQANDDPKTDKTICQAPLIKKLYETLETGRGTSQDELSRLEKAKLLAKLMHQEEEDSRKKEMEELVLMMKGPGLVKAAKKALKKQEDQSVDESAGRSALNGLGKKRSKSTANRDEQQKTKTEQDDNCLDTSLVESVKQKSAAKKQERESYRHRQALKRIPALPHEVDGDTREITREIETNRGLTRKRKKYEGNARVHNKIKYAKKMKRTSGTTMKAATPQASGGYAGEAAGITMHVTRSRKVV